jgi:hypothetical protein
MKDFVEYIAKQLVDQPEQVFIDEESKDEKLILKLKVAQPDIAYIGCCSRQKNGKESFPRSNGLTSFDILKDIIACCRRQVTFLGYSFRCLQNCELLCSRKNCRMLRHQRIC